LEPGFYSKKKAIPKKKLGLDKFRKTENAGIGLLEFLGPQIKRKAMGFLGKTGGLWANVGHPRGNSNRDGYFPER